MNNKDIINKFREIVEESREEDIYNYYTNLRNTLELLEKLEKENEVLNNKQTKIIADSFHEKMTEKFDEDFIPKYKIKEKIEELEKEKEDVADEINFKAFYRITDLKNIEIDILQKLL